MGIFTLYKITAHVRLPELIPISVDDESLIYMVVFGFDFANDASMKNYGSTEPNNRSGESNVGLFLTLLSPLQPVIRKGCPSQEKVSNSRR